MTIKKEIKKINKQIDEIGDNIQDNIEDVEKWIIARRKFLIKLIWVVGLILALLIISHIYLRISVGV